MELLGTPVISCIWSKEAMKLDTDCFEGICFSSWCCNQLKHVEYYHKSQVLSLVCGGKFTC